MRNEELRIKVETEKGKRAMRNEKLRKKEKRK